MNYYHLLSTTLGTTLAKNAAAEVGRAMDKLAVDLAQARQEYKGARLAKEEKQLKDAVLAKFAVYQKRAELLRAEVKPVMPACPYTREDLQEIRQGLRPGLVTYDMVGRPVFDSVKVRALLEDAKEKGEDHILWAIATSPERIAPETAQGFLGVLPAGAEEKLYDADNFAGLYAQLSRDLATDLASE